MGYETNFSGAFKITPQLEEKHRAYLDAFGSTRRMRRNPKITATMEDKLREAVGLPVGPEGDFYVGDTKDLGQNHTSDIVDYNNEPSAQHGLWCGWSPNEEGTELYAQDGKNYSYIEWLKYIVENFLTPWGYSLTGEVEWSGRQNGDMGKIKVTDNKVKVLRAKVYFVEEEP